MKSKKHGKLRSDFSNDSDDLLSKKRRSSDKVKRTRKPSIYDEMDDELINNEDFSIYNGFLDDSDDN
jgi:hypothetical protein